MGDGGVGSSRHLTTTTTTQRNLPLFSRLSRIGRVRTRSRSRDHHYHNLPPTMHHESWNATTTVAPGPLEEFRIGILRFLFCSPSPPSSPASFGRPGRLRAARLAPGGPAGGPGPASGGRAGEIGRDPPPFLVHACVFLVHA